MLRLALFFILTSYCALALSSSRHQIDLIVFTQSQWSLPHTEKTYLPIINKNINLKKDRSNSNQAFHLLNPTRSSLSNEYYALTHKAAYKVLAHYSWLQPNTNQNTINLPEIQSQDLIIRGTVRVRRSNYYLFDSQLDCVAADKPHTVFSVTQNHRLNANVAYYLDHPQVQMLIKIREVG